MSENVAVVAARRLLSEENGEVRHRAVAACALDEPARHGCDFFATILTETDDPMMMWYAIRALGELRCEQADAALLAVLHRPDVELATSSLHRITAWAAGKLASRLRDPLVALLRHRDGSVVKAAADALGEIGPDEDAADLLADLVAERDLDVALWAALALRKAGNAATPSIRRVLPNVDGQRALLLIDALARNGDPASVPVLVEARRLFREAFAAFLTPDHRAALALFATQVIRNDDAYSDDAVSLLTSMNEIDGERQLPL
jgi:HEAT repeat protein